MSRPSFVLIISTSLLVALASAQSGPRSPSNVSIPRVIRFRGTLNLDVEKSGGSGQVESVTFALYKDQQGGVPLWIETQNVKLDAAGRFSVQLGATAAQGMPAELFNSGDARWLGIRANGAPEESRVLLVSVPYALKAADSETLGGLPASAFMLAGTPNTTPAGPAASANLGGEAPPPPPGALTGSGTTNYVPLWTGSSSLGNSALFQTGSGSATRIGINTSTPSSTLDVKGAATFRGAINLAATGIATPSSGKVSQSQNFTAQAYNGNTSTGVNQTFHWRAEPVNNNTSAASASLNLLFAQGLSTPAETGLAIASNGRISFASGQSFPGTIAGVTPGVGLTGGGSSGTITLNIDPNNVPLLTTANTFSGNQTVNGNLSATGLVSSSGYQIGSRLFGFGSTATNNAFLGFAGNTTTSGNLDLGIGYNALSSLTSGRSNTGTGAYALAFTTSGYRNAALGTDSLYSNTIGYSNTAVGYQALLTNVDATNNTAIGDSALANLTGVGHNTAVGSGAMLASLDGGGNTAVGFEAGYSFHGQFNTYLGYEAGFDLNANLTNSTAIGANSEVEASNAMILGGLGGNAVTVGIGTSAPYNDYALDVETIHSNGVIDGGVVVNASGGNLYLGMTNTVHKFRVDTNGGVYADGGFSANGADFAESVAVDGTRSQYEPGDVLEIDQRVNRHLALSHRPYATLVAGIYSTKPGMLASPRHIDEAPSETPEVPLAIMGIVPCKVTTENGPITRGDLLVTSSLPGYAMKGTDRRRMLGAVVGKALEPLAKGEGVIEVLVTLQ